LRSSCTSALGRWSIGFSSNSKKAKKSESALIYLTSEALQNFGQQTQHQATTLSQKVSQNQIPARMNSGQLLSSKMRLKPNLWLRLH
jgi:hypothetical protein